MIKASGRTERVAQATVWYPPIQVRLTWSTQGPDGNHTVSSDTAAAMTPVEADDSRWVHAMGAWNVPNLLIGQIDSSGAVQSSRLEVQLPTDDLMTAYSTEI